MNRSFAHSRERRHRRHAPALPVRPRVAVLLRAAAAAAALALAACATLPPPTAELAAAAQAVATAGDADAAHYAAQDYESARNELLQAQAAMAAGDDAAARTGALVAAAGGDLARERSRAAVLDNDYAQRRDEIARLRAQLQVDDTDTGPVPPALQDGDAMAPQMRLQALETDPRYAGVAAYERLRAEQAVQAVATAKSRDRQSAMVLASRRVAIAELAAHAELVQAAVRRLEQVRGDLLLEASRREADRARQEAERLRLQAQIQAEEADRLRAAAEAEATARQQAEDVILDVGGEQAEKLKAARDRDAELARQEAELLQAQQAAGGAPAPAKAAPRPAPKPASKPVKKKK